MASYKEIVTKAVIGKGKKYFKNNYSINVENYPATVLGCWIINHNFKGYKDNAGIGVTGSFDVNIWYSYDSDSKTTVVNKNFEYNDLFNLKAKNDIDSSDTDIIVRSLKQPTCSKVEINGNVISFDVEKELGVEIVGETKIKIGIEDDEEPWEELVDEVTDEVINEIDANVDENYIK